MFLKRVKVDDFRVLKNVDLTFEPDFVPSTFPLGSLNGGGKSTLLQLIFTLLHCSFDEAKKEYLVNLLSPVVQDKPDYFSLATFELIHDDRECSLEFITLKLDSNDFSAFFEMDSVENIRQYQFLSGIIEELNSLIIQDNVEQNIGYFLAEVLSSNSSKLTGLQKLSDSLKYVDTKSECIALITHVEEYYRNILASIDKLQNFIFIKQIDFEVYLLCKTTESLEFLKDISRHVYLAAPSTQIFLFLPVRAKQTLFSATSSYSKHVNSVKNKLLGLFTYDFAPVKIIIDSFIKANKKDLIEAVKVGNYGNNLKNLRTDLDSFFFGKSITLNEELNQVIFKFKETGEELSPEDLSHGELKKLGIYVWLKYQEIENALVLMDEIEIGLHPDWQYEIANELQEWSHGNQFILATHSYELCQALTPSHVKELSPKLIK